MRQEHVSFNTIPEPDRSTPGAFIPGGGWTAAYAAAYELSEVALWNSPRSPGYATTPPILPLADTEIEENRQAIIHFAVSAGRFIGADPFESMVIGMKAADRYSKWLALTRAAGDRPIDNAVLASYTFGPVLEVTFAQPQAAPAPGSIPTTLKQMDDIMGNTGRSHLDPPRA
jgi:hypothetical protein